MNDIHDRCLFRSFSKKCSCRPLTSVHTAAAKYWSSYGTPTCCQQLHNFPSWQRPAPACFSFHFPTSGSESLSTGLSVPDNGSWMEEEKSSPEKGFHSKSTRIGRREQNGRRPTRTPPPRESGIQELSEIRLDGLQLHTQPLSTTSYGSLNADKYVARSHLQPCQHSASATEAFDVFRFPYTYLIKTQTNASLFNPLP